MIEPEIHLRGISFDIRFLLRMSQKQSKSSTPSSIFRAAFERLSLRSRRKKEIKYDLVIEQKQKVIADVDKNEHDFDLVTQEMFKTTILIRNIF